MEKKKSIVSYKKLPKELKLTLEKQYPFGIENGLINMKDQHGVSHKALMPQLEDHIYLVKMTKKEVRNIVEGHDSEDIHDDVSLQDITDFSGDDFEPNLA